MSSDEQSFDDETWERALFARREATDVARSDAPALDLDDVLARVDAQTKADGAVSVVSVARVVTLANAFAAAAACLALVRGVPAETDGSTDHARDDSPNMTMIVPRPAIGQGTGTLACVAGDVVRGEAACSDPMMTAARRVDDDVLLSSAVSSVGLSCTDEVTCGAIRP